MAGSKIFGRTDLKRYGANIFISSTVAVCGVADYEGGGMKYTIIAMIFFLAFFAFLWVAATYCLPLGMHQTTITVDTPWHPASTRYKSGYYLDSVINADSIRDLEYTLKQWEIIRKQQEQIKILKRAIDNESSSGIKYKIVGHILCISGECDTTYSLEPVEYVKRLRKIVAKHGDTVFIREHSSFFHKESK